MKEDFTFIERVLGFEGAFLLQQQVLKRIQKLDTSKESETVPANARVKPKSYTDYMNELAPHELDLLFEAYENDFNIFDYDPCLDINNTS